MPFYRFKFHDILTISPINPKILYLHKFSQQWLKHMSDLKKNFLSIPRKIIPTKISIPTKIMPTYTNKFLLSSKMGLLNHAYTSNFHKFIPTKNQVKIHPTIPKAIYNAKLHKPSTLSKPHNIKQLKNSKMPQNKKKIKKKINMTTQWFPTKSYNVRNSHKSKQQQNDNAPP